MLSKITTTKIFLKRLASQPKAQFVLSSVSIVAGVTLLGYVWHAQHLKSTSPIEAKALPMQSKPVVAAQQTTTAPTPKPTPAPAPTLPPPKPKAVATTSSLTPAPVVTPSPSSNVTGLTPTGTTGSSSSPSGSSSGSGASSGGSQPETNGYTSYNWSGYLAAGQTFTAVSGAWTVPTATGNGHSTSADSSWIGIGGVTSSDLIQVGTENTVSRSGQLTSSAFYELLPAASQIIPSMTVSAGDNMTASINQTAPGQWVVTINDTTNDQTYTTTLSYSSSYSTAEWIEEDPSFARGNLVPFDNFGTASFASSTAIGGGASQNLTATNAQPVTMVNIGGQPVATPSAVASGTSFTVSHN